MTTNETARLASEIWAMEPRHLERFIAEVSHVVPLTAEAHAHARSVRAERARSIASQRGDTAVIKIHGPLLKDVPLAFGLFGIKATSTQDVSAALSAAMADDTVSSIVLDIDSPGGTLSGVQELADQVLVSRETKPIHAHASDMMASAAYWIGSQASKVTANKTAEVGSIGVYTVLDDTSGAAAKDGIKVHVVSSGEHKGVGVDGAPITAEQLQVEQDLIDKAAAMFIDTISTGRTMHPDQVADSATGRVWFAEEAKDRGLIDDVMSLEQVLNEATAGGPNQGGDTVTDNVVAAAPTSGGVDNAQPNEMAELKKELAAAKAREEAIQATLAEQNKQRCAELIDAYVKDGRVAPSAREAIDRLAAAHGFDADALKVDLDKFPRVTRPETVSAEADPVPTSIEPGMFGHSERTINAFDNVVGATLDGRFKLADGRILTKEEVLNGRAN